jgi:hypothetical protein
MLFGSFSIWARLKNWNYEAGAFFLILNWVNNHVLEVILYLRIKNIRKKLGIKNNLISENSKYMNDHE